MRKIVHRDDNKRLLYFLAAGIDANIDPYYTQLCSVNLDKGVKSLKVLTPEAFQHDVRLIPEAGTFIDISSRSDQAFTFIYRSLENGEVIKTLAKSDWSELKEKGLSLPEPFKAKGRDAKTDIFGVIWRPVNFDPQKSYPIIEYIYNGPHCFSTPKSFSVIWARQQALANLGFIVVQCDAMGTAKRSKIFHDVSYKNLGDGGFLDRILFLKAVNKVIALEYLEVRGH